MATPILRRSINRVRHSGQEKFPPLPLVTRRFLAWTAEVLLVIASMLIPFGIGIYIRSQFVGGQVPVNPVLAVIAEALAKTLNLSIDLSDSNVAPLTNLFWSVALVAPIVLIVWQLFLLAKTGNTLPKRWLGVRVVTSTLKPPGIRRVLLREGIGSWGLPLLLAYLLWRYIGESSSTILVGVSSLMVLAEGMSARFHPQRRCLHDRLAGTYVIDANRPLGFYQGQISHGRFVSRSYQQTGADAEAALTGVAPTPKSSYPRRRNWWRWMRRHPYFVMLLAALFSMAAVLGTLVGTQVYIQTQANQRAFEQHNSQQFLTLLKQLSPNSSATLEERQRAILGLGTLKDPQALQLLVNLLGQETNDTLLDKIQQALVNSGPQALPYLQRLNQYFASSAFRDTITPEKQALWIQRLQETQWAIAKILMVESGKLHSVDLNRVNLGQTNTASGSFTLMLDKVDLAGIQLRATNLNHASFRGTQFRGAGEDGRLDTSDDWIADLSDAQMQAANLTKADLSHVLMNRTNLVLATLNRANLSMASLIGANLSSTRLVEANLHGAVLTDASLTGADLAAADLGNANLSGARLGQVSALGTKMPSADLSQSDWRGSDLSQADFSDANLHDADFSNTRLTGANFHNAQMTNVNLRNADLNLADLRGANLAGADLLGAILGSSQLAPKQQFKRTNPSSPQSALVKGVDFSKVRNLDTKQIAYICTQGGNHPRCP